MKEYNQEEMDDIIMNEIKNRTEDIDIPKSLAPQNMMEKIKKEKERKRRFNRRVRMASSVLAASIILIVGFVATGKVLNNGEISPSVENNQPVKDNSDKLTSFNDYEEIYELISEARRNEDDKIFNEISDDSVIPDSEISMGVGKEESVGPGQDYTDTNVQVEGINEADIVKTDGKYIYVYDLISGEKISIKIIEAKEKDTEVVSEVTINIRGKECLDYGEMYLYDDKLIVIYTLYSDEEMTIVNTYDVSDAKAPKLIGEVKNNGLVYTSRMADGILYLFSEKYIDIYYGKDDKEKQVPIVNGKMVECNDIYKSEACGYNMYITMCSLDVNNPDKVIDVKSILTNYSYIYVSKENIYVLAQDSEEDKGYVKSVTNISKFKYKDGEFEPMANRTIEGEIRDQFAMDEYDGTLRILTTTDRTKINYSPYSDVGIVEEVIAFSGNDTSNNVYVLDKNLEVLGKITGLAKGERIYSARFDGDMGYFVTFRETDPVFAVDFSDKNNPRIAGELKIPGFSEYLHMWSENLMFGIGEEVEEKTGKVIGIKLSMFDITNPENMVEIDKIVLEGDVWSEALHNHKALLINPEKNIIGFDVDEYLSDTYINDYYIFGYDKENGFVQKGKVAEYNGFYGKGLGSVRGINIGEMIYITYKGDSINVFDTNKNEVIANVNLE